MTQKNRFTYFSLVKNLFLTNPFHESRMTKPYIIPNTKIINYKEDGIMFRTVRFNSQGPKSLIPQKKSFPTSTPLNMNQSLANSKFNAPSSFSTKVNPGKTKNTEINQPIKESLTQFTFNKLKSFFSYETKKPLVEAMKANPTQFVQKFANVITRHIENPSPQTQKVVDSLNHNLEKIISELDKVEKDAKLEATVQKMDLRLKSIDHSLQNIDANLSKLVSEQKVGLDKIANVDQSQLENLAKKLDDAANNRLTMIASYATILSVIVVLAIFLYQSIDQKTKEEEAKILQLEKIRLKSEEVQKKIAEIQQRYINLKVKEDAVTKKIFRLEKKKEELNASKAKQGYIQSLFNTNDPQKHIDELTEKLEDLQADLRTIHNELTVLQILTANQYDLEQKFKSESKSLIYDDASKDEQEIRSHGMGFDK